MTNNNIWIQPGTRLHMLVYKKGMWQVWVATDSRSGDSDTWLGTYMELYDDGRCEQVYRGETTVRTIVVREGTRPPHDAIPNITEDE